RDNKVVLMVDEVDKTSNNQVFLHFLGMLRDKFLLRKNRKDFTFHSVILAGVYDIKTIKLKMINEGKYPRAAEENKIYNSPWNIAVNFTVDMSFSPHEIATMLSEYKADHNTAMDNRAISDEIYRFTSGYPFLVSRICQAIDEELDQDWTPGGVQKAVQKLLKEQNTLFEDLFKNVKNNSKLSDFLYDLLFIGIEKNFNIDNSLVNLGYMYGFFKESGGKVKVANKIFETRIYNYFVSENEDNKEIAKITGVLQQDVVRDGKFDLELCLLKFAEHYAEIFGGCDLKFIEKKGRLLFLLYLRPLINGKGFYHIESQFTDLRRMDIVVDFGRDQFIIELKIWNGNSRHQEAYDQLLGYMENKKALNGYLLTFDFRKEANKQRRAKWVDFEGGKRIFDVVL
ncbi:MAG: AAA family ATPase, partial [Clostridiales bacterium]|nr:AAA family ATPase [Clostridiales bacterium]